MQRDFEVPGAMVERVLRWLDAGSADAIQAPAGDRAPDQVPPVRDAATVMLLRPAATGTAGPGSGTGACSERAEVEGAKTDRGVEVFLLRRVRAMAFAAGMHVFPGGAVDPRDDDPDLTWIGPPPGELAQRLGTDPAGARALYVAAARETFEECGVLLAGRSADDLVTEPATPDWEADRRRLVAAEVSLGEVLNRRGLGLRADLLRLWAHWLTPPFEARRYDTRFFVAALPAGQQARDLGGEADHAAWWSPGAALAGQAAGELLLMPPTLVCLQDLAAAADLAAIWQAPRNVRRVMPEAVRGSAGSVTLRVELP